MGRRFHLLLDPRRVRLHVIRRRCVLAPNSRVEGDDDEGDAIGVRGSRQALFTRRRTDFAFTATGLVHHSDAGSQYTSLAFTEALIESGLAGSIGSVGDALDNALMESTIGLYKTELIDRQKSWTGRSEVERETASWVHWFNTSRLHSSIGYLSPVDYENEYRQKCSTAISDREVA